MHNIFDIQMRVYILQVGLNIFRKKKEEIKKGKKKEGKGKKKIKKRNERKIRKAIQKNTIKL